MTNCKDDLRMGRIKPNPSEIQSPGGTGQVHQAFAWLRGKIAQLRARVCVNTGLLKLFFVISCLKTSRTGNQSRVLSSVSELRALGKVER